MLPLGLAALYQVSLALHPARIPLFPDWSFGADSMEEVFRGISESLAGHKHPLFTVVAIPLYQMGGLIYRFVPGSVGENLVLVFPTAVLGGVCVMLAYRLFRYVDGGSGNAFLLAVSFGFSASAWVFFSFPETYALTALMTTIFLWVFITRRDQPGIHYLIPVSNALACYASPTQIFLAVIPCFYFLKKGNWDLSAWKRAARYLFYMGSLFVIPYGLYLELAGLGWKLAPGYVLAYADYLYLLKPAWYLVVGLNSLLFSVVGPIAHPDQYTAPALSLFSDQSALWFAVSGLYLILLLWSVYRLLSSQSSFSDIGQGIILYILISAGFYLFFNPSEAFLYGLPNLIVIFLMILIGMSPARRRSLSYLLLPLAFGLGVNNFSLIRFLNGLR